ncbi:MAG TPA: hypothetical protein VN635_11675 [Conexibacter sp.]|nr:hypothetical protein [Conexibacter sp.]
MSRLRRAAGLATVLLAAAAMPAGAHQGNPNFRSVVQHVTPALPGLRVQVLGFDNEMQLTNRSGRTVVVYGYNGEPYARLLADGTVQVNRRSPALYLNEDRYGTTPVPPSANAQFAPQWVTQDRVGTFVWHDHRMHWMAQTIPPKVRDKAKRTTIFAYAIPLQAGGARGAIAGTLYWIGSPSGFPVAAVVSLVVLLLLAVGAVVLVRRRRASGGPGGGAPREGAPAKEAW